MASKNPSQIVKLFKEKYNIHITFESISLNNPELELLSESLFHKVYDRKVTDLSLITKLKSIISLYPDIPIFYNYLYAAYHKNGKIHLATELLNTINNKFPDYIFGVTQRAIRLILEDEIEEAKKWLGTVMDISIRFPKEKYHYSEVKVFYHAFFDLSLKEKDFIKAKEILKILWELYPNEKDLVPDVLKYQSEKLSNLKFYDHIYTPTIHKNRLPLNIPEQSYDQEIFELITYEDLSENDTNPLYKFKNEYLCEELFKICVSIYHNFDTIDDDNYNTLITAFEILSTLNYNEAYSLFLLYLNQDKEFVEFFWHENDENVVEKIAFNFGKNDPDPLLTLLMDENMDDMVRTEIFEALVQLVLHGFLQREKLISCYHHLIELYLNKLDNDLFIPTYFLTMLVAKATDLNNSPLIEKAKPLFDANKIDVSYFGSYENHLKEINTWAHEYSIRHFPKDLKDYFSGNYLKLNKTKPLSAEEKSLFSEDYEDGFETFLLDCMISVFKREKFDDEDADYDHAPETGVKNYVTHKPVVNSNKIGRNDPCPCGSGKKFKKCCINKGIFK